MPEEELRALNLWFNTFFIDSRGQYTQNIFWGANGQISKLKIGLKMANCISSLQAMSFAEINIFARIFVKTSGRKN